jgi:hypothetical protein
LILGIYAKSVSGVPDFKYILDHYEKMPTPCKDKFLTKTMEIFASTPADSIFTYDTTQAVAYEGGTFSYLRIYLGFGEELGSKFGSIQRLIDFVPHVKSGEKLLLVFGNILKAYEEEYSSQGSKVHG